MPPASLRGRLLGRRAALLEQLTRDEVLEPAYLAALADLCVVLGHLPAEDASGEAGSGEL